MEVDLGPLRQIAQHADDVDRAVGFYRDVLGMTMVARFGDLAFFDLAGVRLLIEPGAPGTTLYLSVDDIHGARDELVVRGVVFEDEPHLIFRDEGGTFGDVGDEEWMTFFRDSEGNVLALSYRGPAPG